MADEVGERVQGYRQSEKRVGPFFLQAARPGGDGEGAYEKSLGSLGEGPAASRPELQDGQAGRWRMGRTLVEFDLLHGGVLNADLFTQERDFPLGPLDICLMTKLGIEAVGGPA